MEQRGEAARAGGTARSALTLSPPTLPRRQEPRRRQHRRHLLPLALFHPGLSLLIVLRRRRRSLLRPPVAATVAAAARDKVQPARPRPLRPPRRRIRRREPLRSRHTAGRRLGTGCAPIVPGERRERKRAAGQEELHRRHRNPLRPLLGRQRGRHAGWAADRLQHVRGHPAKLRQRRKYEPRPRWLARRRSMKTCQPDPASDLRQDNPR